MVFRIYRNKKRTNNSGGVSICFTVPDKSISTMTSCTNAEFVRADLLFENFASEDVSMNGSLYPSSVIWRKVSLAFRVFCQNSYFTFSFFFTEVYFCSDLYSKFSFSDISVKIAGIVLKSLRPEKQMELPSVVIFVWRIGFWTPFLPMTCFFASHASVGDFWRSRGMDEGDGLCG